MKLQCILIPRIKAIPIRLCQQRVRREGDVSSLIKVWHERPELSPVGGRRPDQY